MTRIISSKYSKTLSAIFALALITIYGAMPVWATDEVVTNEVVPTKTGHPWFYWPGWAFIGLVLLVLATVGYAWYKTIFIPKYRGQKVAQ